VGHDQATFRGQQVESSGDVIDHKVESLGTVIGSVIPVCNRGTGDDAGMTGNSAAAACALTPALVLINFLKFPEILVVFIT
jgi:hypothetical protein